MSFYLRPSLITWSSQDFEGGVPLVLSDASREPMRIDVERLEQRERMASGRMRSKFIADKHTFELSWTYLPTRSVVSGQNAVADGYASASDLKRFYDAVQGEFTMKVYADNGSGPSLDVNGLYDQYKVFFSSFSATVEKRGQDFDIHSVNVSLEES
jgi:hypothetical protein